MTDENNNIENEDLQEDFLEGSLEEEVLYTTFPGPRIFTFNNQASTTIVGVLIKETDDSFLVGLPSKIITTEEGNKVEPFITVPFFRLLKYNIQTVIPVYGIFKDTYIPFLKKEGRSLYPEISEIIDDIEEMFDLEQEAIPLEEIKEDKQNEKTDELSDYLEEKIARGELVYGSSSKH